MKTFEVVLTLATLGASERRESTGITLESTGNDRARAGARNSRTIFSKKPTIHVPATSQARPAAPRDTATDHAAAHEGRTPSARVIGGHDAAPGAHPYMVSLGPGPGYVWICAGTLIHPEWILTVAHAVDPVDVPRCETLFAMPAHDDCALWFKRTDFALCFDERTLPAVQRRLPAAVFASVESSVAPAGRHGRPVRGENRHLGPAAHAAHRRAPDV
mmetsp:Transcript_4131/g.12864  ORF Transcript_4131/g.12864 Transcript_4131/m.12864 type:complete len:217 (-) Transcript_4131:347-997(-)